MIQLLAGIAEGRSLVGVFDPDGVASEDDRALRALVGGGRLLRVRFGPGQTPGTAVAGELFDLDSTAEELALPTVPPGEVLAAGYRRWGKRFLTRLRGSFALLLVPAQGQALLAADASAGHSIVFHTRGERLVFASEVHLLLRLLPTRPPPNSVAVAHWLASGTTRPAGETMYEGVSELQGGECLELTASGWSPGRFWAPRYEPPFELSRREAGEVLWTSLSRAVAARVQGSERVGVVMSSGVDSSAVAAAAALSGSASRIHSYSGVFPGTSHLDESERIDVLVRSLGLPNTQVVVEPGGAFDLSLEWLAAWELPVRDLSCSLERPLLEIARSQGIVGLLDGQYGDESFGAPTYLIADRLRQCRLLSSARLARRLPDAEESHWQAWKRFGLTGAAPLGLQRACRRLRPPTPAHLTRATSRLVVETDVTEDWKRVDAPRWWAEKAHLLTVDRQADGIGTYVRQRAAIMGLRARPPLFDIDVIETVLRLPPWLEFDPLLDRVLVREAMAGRVPDALRLSPWKSDLGPFYLAGLAGPDNHAIRSVLTESKELGAYANPAAVRRLVEGRPRWPEPGWRAWVTALWKLATAECWLRAQSDASFAERLRPMLQRPRGTVYRTS